MDSFVYKEGDLRTLSSAAAVKIFAYVKENKEVSASPWVFDRGTTSDDRRSIQASFSCANLNGRDKDELTVSATVAKDGSIKITHMIKRAT
jgi:hypothetical protein